LSAKACAGILRRAANRGKELPQLLARALRAVAGSEPISNSMAAASRKPSGGGNCSGPIDAAACLTAKGQRVDFEVETFVAESAATLPAGGNETGGNRQPGMSAETAATFLVAHALRADGFDASEDGTGRGTPIVPVAYRITPNDGAYASGGSAPSLTTGTDQSAIALVQNWAVRRLTPTECHRLMGVPDGFLNITYRGKPAADGPQYKALGNSQGTNVMRWIGRGLADVVAALR